MIEQKIVSLKERLDHLTPVEGIKFLTLQMSPCVLHFETRMGIKQLELVLLGGLSNSNKGALEGVQKIKSEHCRE